MLCIKKLLTITLTAALLLISGMTVAQADLSDGLVAYYPFNGNANDESGNGNNGTITNGSLNFFRDNIGESAEFNGQEIEIKNFINFQVYGTIAFWMKTNNSGDHFIISKQNSNSPWTGYYIRMGFENGKINFGYQDSIGNDLTIKYEHNYTDNNWRHYAFILDDIKAYLYVNGVKVNEVRNDNMGSVENTGNMFIGGMLYSGNAYDLNFYGVLDEMRFYNRALSDSEIQELYQEGGGSSNNGNLSISNNPVSGSSGTTFIQSGKGFTPNSTATIHCKKPDGTEYPTISQRIDAIGHFEIKYTAPWDKPAGTYTWWAVDGVTGKASGVASYQITQAQSALQVQTINPQSDESFYKQFFPYPNTANLINGGNQSTIISADGKSYLLVRLVSDNASEVTISESESDITHNGGLSGIAH